MEQANHDSWCRTLPFLCRVGAELTAEDIKQLCHKLTESEEQQNKLQEQIKQERLASTEEIQQYHGKLEASEEQLIRLVLLEKNKTGQCDGSSKDTFRGGVGWGTW